MNTGNAASRDPDSGNGDGLSTPRGGTFDTGSTSGDGDGSARIEYGSERPGAAREGAMGRELPRENLFLASGNHWPLGLSGRVR
ncbi:hypothetical protein HNR06_002877 [Nocardiopsis arvandica]|uniref:Uncharacterized protein n=1 Tax=Nocardiopsis sinuspersici TaxID=501010 RepID=A0A7Y9XCP1_9ACTN|nr:hypothetical protein [Nocardiopsis sinuspersici]